MASHNQPMPPPIRTNTADSQKSQSSGHASPLYSPASATSRTATSPTEESFFGAISARIRGRSRSRSRGATSRKGSKSPIMPPEQALPRHVPAASPTTPTRPSAVPIQGEAHRRSTSDSNRSDPWRGRHSNDWLFNGISVTATAKDFIQRRK